MAGSPCAAAPSAMAMPADTMSGHLGVRGYPTRPLPDLPWLGAVSSLLGAFVYLATLVSLVVRYRRGDERVRRQLLWLLLAALAMVTTFAVSDLLQIDSWFGIFVIALVPLAISV